MHPHLLGLKVALANTAAAIVPAAAVVQVSETAQQAQMVDHSLVALSLILGVVSSIFALAWNGYQIARSVARWHREQKERRGERND